MKIRLVLDNNPQITNHSIEIKVQLNLKGHLYYLPIASIS